MEIRGEAGRMNCEGLIQVKQLPVITEQLYTVRRYIEDKAALLTSLACSEDTVKSVKAMRADFRKNVADLDGQYKAVKEEIMKPLGALDAVYKECVTEPFEAADADAKCKIDEVEAEIKGRCEDELREYFDELCVNFRVDFISFEQAGIKVDMASAKQKTHKKLKEQLWKFVQGVSETVDAIDSMEDEELMVEYKRCLDLSKAMGIVQDRRRAMEAERKRRLEMAPIRAREVEAVARVEAAALPVEVQTEEIVKCAFTVYATKPQLKKLKDFLIKEGIKYE